MVLERFIEKILTPKLGEEDAKEIGEAATQVAWKAARLYAATDPRFAAAMELAQALRRLVEAARAAREGEAAREKPHVTVEFRGLDAYLDAIDTRARNALTSPEEIPQGEEYLDVGEAITLLRDDVPRLTALCRQFGLAANTEEE